MAGLIHTLRGHTGSVRTLAITSDNQTLISGSFDGTIKLWQLDTGEFLGNLTKNAGQVAAIALTPGNLIASGGTDGLISLWSINSARADTQTSPTRILTGNLSSVCSLAISPDGKILVAGCTDGTVKVWQLDTLTLLDGFQGHSGQVMSVVFSGDGQTLITGSADGTIKIWHLKAAKQVGVLMNDSADSVQAVAISPNGQLIAGGGAGSIVKIWQRD